MNERKTIKKKKSEPQKDMVLTCRKSVSNIPPRANTYYAVEQSKINFSSKHRLKLSTCSLNIRYALKKQWFSLITKKLSALLSFLSSSIHCNRWQKFIILSPASSWAKNKNWPFAFQNHSYQCNATVSCYSWRYFGIQDVDKRPTYLIVSLFLK